ncbi:hypothetical protein J7J62_08970 [bacterium]|nr:hypothetical protein [bacterium]
MCIIAYCKTRKLNYSELTNCWCSNSDGAGIAWQGNGLVYFKKGFMELNEFKEFYDKFDNLPHAVHFRTQTSGGICQELTHPFKLDFDNPLQGKTKQGVLFHNGVISNWQSKLDLIAYYCIRKNRKFPIGKMSDSRVMAILVKILGIGYLESIGAYDRFLIMRPTVVVMLGDWIKENGVYFSNMDYEDFSIYNTDYDDDLAGLSYGYEWQRQYKKNKKKGKVKLPW